MIINDAGTYTLRYTATDDCGNATEVDRELVVTAPVYGVYWDGSESSAWTRIGKSASFVDPVSQYSDGDGGWIGGSSPFDDIMPWSGMEIVEDAEAGTLVSIPKFYYKWTHGLGDDENGLQLEISTSPQEGFFTSPAHADRGDGVGERNIVYVGRYPCAGNDAKSVAQLSPSSWLSRDGFRTRIHNLGQNVWQWDYSMFWTIAMLYLVEFANWNSQNMIGFGGLSTVPGGRTDTMQYHTGTDVSSKSSEGVVQYRNIEGLWSNSNTFIDGIYMDNDYVYAIKDPSLFNDSENGTNIGSIQGNGGNPKKFSHPPVGFEYALFPIEYQQVGNYSSYVCDYYKIAANSILIKNVQNNERNGLFYFSSVQAGTSGVGKGSRLMKLPSA